MMNECLFWDKLVKRASRFSKKGRKQGTYITVFETDDIEIQKRLKS